MTCLCCSLAGCLFGGCDPVRGVWLLVGYSLLVCLVGWAGCQCLLCYCCFWCLGLGFSGCGGWGFCSVYSSDY